MNIAQSIEHSASRVPQKQALIFDNGLVTEVFTYQQLNEFSSRVANGLKALNIMQGDCVAIALPNSPAFVFTYFGIQKLGAFAVTMNTALKGDEIQFILNDSGAKVLITTNDLYESLTGKELPHLTHTILIDNETKEVISLADLMAEASPEAKAVEMNDDDPSMLLYTSGTTGFPKGAVHSHRNILYNGDACIRHFELDEHDNILYCMPLFHTFGQNVALNPSFAMGATLILHPQFEPETVLRSLQMQETTIFFGVPTLFNLLYEHAAPAHFHTVRRFISSASTLPPALAQKWIDKFGMGINECYGSSEAFAITFNADVTAKPNSVGKPMDGVEICMMDEQDMPVPFGEQGELAVRGGALMLGYWNRPEETAFSMRNGWFHSGDIGIMDEDGYVYIVDRLKDMVNLAGNKVYPSEVENILYKHPAVKEAAVYGITDENFGETVVASVVVSDQSQVTSRDLADHCRQHLADFKVPGIVRFIDDLPKSRTGKILKRELRIQAQSEAMSNMLLVGYTQVKDKPREERCASIAKLLHVHIVSALEPSLSPSEEPIPMDTPLNTLIIDSLMVAILYNRLIASQVDISVVQFWQRTINELAVEIDQQLSEADIDAIWRKEPSTAFDETTPRHLQDDGWQPISLSQQYYFNAYHQCQSINPSILQMHQALHIRSEVDIPSLRRACQAIVDRHDALRVVFTGYRGRGYQKLHTTTTIDFQVIDAQTWTEEQLKSATAQENDVPWDLANDLGIKFRLYILSNQDSLFHMVFNHLVMDGWSCWVMLDELRMLYQAETTGEPANLPPSGWSMLEYNQWLSRRLQSEEGEKMWRYWREALKGEVACSRFPTDYTPPLPSGLYGRFKTMRFDHDLYKKVKQFIQQEKTTELSFFLSVLKILLYKYNGDSKVQIGTLFSSRVRPEIEHTLGNIVNIKSIASHLSDELTLKDVCAMVQEKTIEGLIHQDYPLLRIAEQFGLDTGMGSMPLVQTQLTVDRVPAFPEVIGLFDPANTEPIDFGGLTAEPYTNFDFSAWQMNDLCFSLIESPQAMLFMIYYNPYLYKEDTIVKIYENMVAISQMIIESPSQQIGQVHIEY